MANAALPMAGGVPISESVADAAADWLTVLMSGEATDHDRRRLDQWRAENPEHERAWLHVEAVVGRLRIMHADSAYRALTTRGSQRQATPNGRRNAIRALLWSGIAIGTTTLASRMGAIDALRADYRTGTGEQRTVALDDGTSLTLNTNTSIRIAYSASERVIQLTSGEIFIVTGHGDHRAAESRPFFVETNAGTVRALGTQFSVRQDDGSTAVAVLQSAVEVTPREQQGSSRIVRAGERIAFSRAGIESREPAESESFAWTQGRIVADNVRLADFIDEVSRYRPGVLRCDPSVSALRISGVYPITDTDRILAALPRVLPVAIHRRSRYWVTVTRALTHPSSEI